MKTMTLTVNGMMCTHCQARVEKAVADAGAANAKVDLAAKTVTFDLPDTLTVDAVKAAITEAGYEVA